MRSFVSAKKTLLKKIVEETRSKRQRGEMRVGVKDANGDPRE